MNFEYIFSAGKWNRMNVKWFELISKDNKIRVSILTIYLIFQ